jgi:hypothetical protein
VVVALEEAVSPTMSLLQQEVLGVLVETYLQQGLIHPQAPMPRQTKVVAEVAAHTPQQQRVWPVVMEQHLAAAEVAAASQTMATVLVLAVAVDLALFVFGAGNHDLRNSQFSRQVH